MSADHADLANKIRDIQKTPATIAALIAGLSDAKLRWRHSNDEFSALENVCHLRDLEIEGYGLRLERLLSETNPELADFNGARVAAERAYNRESLQHALDAFEAARRNNVSKFERLSDAEWQRTGNLQGVGNICVVDLVEMMHEHDASHLQDVRLLLQQLKENSRFQNDLEF